MWEIIVVTSHVACRMLIEKFTISKDAIYGIFTKQLDKRKVCTQFVPQKLTEDQEKARVEHCKDLIKTIKRIPIFLDSIVTGGSLWCFKYTPKPKCQSASWKQPCLLKKKKNAFPQVTSKDIRHLFLWFERHCSSWICSERCNCHRKLLFWVSCSICHWEWIEFGQNIERLESGTYCLIMLLLTRALQYSDI